MRDEPVCTCMHASEQSYTVFDKRNLYGRHLLAVVLVISYLSPGKETLLNNQEILPNTSS